MATERSRQLVRSDHTAATWEFQSDRFVVQAPTVMIIAILTPLPPVIQATLGSNRTTIHAEASAAAALRGQPISLEGFDAEDTHVLRNDE